MRIVLAFIWWLAVEYGSPGNVPGWPKLLISNDGKDLRLAEPKTNGTVAIDDDAIDIYQLSTLYEYVDYASPFDVAVDERKMFFVRHGAGKNREVTGDTLVAADVDRPKKPPKVLLKNFFPALDGIAVDWVTKKLYLYDADTHRIEVLDYGLHRDDAKPVMTVLIYKDLFVRSLVVDPMSGYMFWLNHFSDTTVERAWMDGTHRRVLFKETGYPNSLSVDCVDGRIYWTIDSDAIWSATIDGRNKTKIIAGLHRPYSVVTFENVLLWGDVSENHPGVYYCDKRYCLQGTRLINKLKPFTLRIFDLRRQPNRLNPCAMNNGNCSHLCLLTPERPLQRSCACSVGVKMLDDGVSCSDGPEEVIITAQRASLRMISLDTPDFTERRIPIDRIKHAVSVDYDPLEGYVYWLDTTLQMIRRVKLNGSGEEDVVVGINAKSEDLAVDWIARNLYWTDAGAGRIEVARIGQPSARRILLSSDVQKPRAIIVDPPRGHLFWTDLSDESPRIGKAFLDGSGPMTLVQFEAGQWPNGLALDAEAGHIYWVDAKWDTLERANAADGSERIMLREHESSHAWGVTILGNYVYWSDMQHRSLEKISKINEGERTLLTDHLTDIMHIKGVNLKHTPTDTNECGISNGGCSHLCFYRPTGRVCMCPLGWELSAGGLRCLVPEGYLVFTRMGVHDIMIASLSRFPTSLDYLRLRNVSQPFSLDFHYKRWRLYWTGMEADKTVISRAYLNGSNVETVVDYGLYMGEALAIDWVAEQMYWSDAGYNHIEMSRLNGRSRKIIIWNATVPRALVVSPTAGRLYWVNWKNEPTIERSDLDGRNRATFLSRVGHVSSLALDHATDRLYWANVDSGTISFADLNGQWHPRVLVSKEGMQPYGLTLFGDRLYWADWHKPTIQMCDKNTGLNETILYINQRLVKSLTAVHALKQQGWNGCSNGDLKCEHLCFAIPYAPHHLSFRCDCPTHFTLASDGRSCLPPSNFVLFVQGSILRRFQTLEHTLDGPIATLPHKNLSNVVSLKYDPLNRAIYWMERVNRSISVRRAQENKGLVETLVFLPNADPVDFALDVTTQSIFWTIADYVHPTRRVKINKYVNGELKDLGDVVADEAFSPSFIAVDPLRGYMFFVDSHSGTSSIVRCKLDGTQCNKLLTENGEFSLLNVDLEDGALFWYNRNRGAIGRVNNDGANYQPDFVGHISSVLDMTISKSRLYFVDGKTSAIQSVDKTRGVDKKDLVLHSYQRMTGVKAILAVDDTITKRLMSADSCQYAKCTHVCYLIPSAAGTEMEANCGCPVGKKLQKTYNGGSECVERAECADDEWHCGGGVCIARRLVCNGYVDCVDGGSDEKNCTCPAGQFTCRSGPVKCAWFAQLCDGVNDCSDASDENLCPVGPHEANNRSTHHYSNSDASWNNALNIVICVVVVALVVACLIYATARWYRCRCIGQKRHGISATTDGATLELRVLHPLNSAAGQPPTTTTTTTTVEYSATCRVIHHGPADSSTASSSSISPLPPPMDYDERPNLTGKSSSSSSDAASSSLNDSRRPKNPPPSLVTVASSRSPESVQYNARRATRPQRRRRRYVYEDELDSSMELAAPAPAARCSTRAIQPRFRIREPNDTDQMYSPPPPYDDCIRENASAAMGNHQAARSRAEMNTPLLYEQNAPMNDQPRRYNEERSAEQQGRRHRRSSNRPRRRTTGSQRRRSGGSGARPPPSSPCSSHRYPYENPPPTPVSQANDAPSACWDSESDGGR